MEKEEKIVNRVQSSSLLTIDLNDYYIEGERAVIDLKDNLENGLLLREQAFREFTGTHDWERYRGKYVSVFCSVDAIIPKWAYMLVASKLSGVARFVVFGDLEELESRLFINQLQQLTPSDFQGKKVVIKGCGKVDTPAAVYLDITNRLTPYVDRLMYGEPCSTVPIYKKPKN